MAIMKSQSVLRKTIEVSVEKTRPSNTTAYTDEDVFSEAASGGTAWTFDGVVPQAGAGGKIVKAMIACDDTNIVPVCSMYLTNVTPTGNLNDNADTKLPLLFVTAAGDDALYGVLVIRSAAHTPTSAAKITVTLTIEPD